MSSFFFILDKISISSPEIISSVILNLNKSFLKEMFSVFYKDAEIEVIAEFNTNLDNFSLQFVCLN